jgi:hypothetical protein
MLKVPYQKFYSVGNVNYYYLDFQDMAYPFVGIETVESIQTHRKTLFGKLFKKEKNIPVALRLMPLNTLILYMLSNVLLLNESTYELDVEGNKIPIYNTWNEHDVADILNEFYRQIIVPAGLSNYSFHKTVKNPVAKGYTKDGFIPIGVEHHGSLNRTYWLVRTNKFGNTHFIGVTETGKDEDPITTSCNTYFVDRTFIDIVINDFKSGKFKKDEKDFQVEEVKEGE